MSAVNQAEGLRRVQMIEAETNPMLAERMLL